MNQFLTRSRVRSVATTLAVALTLTLAAAAGCDSRQEPQLPSVKEKLRKTHIYGQPTLKIGVSTTGPLMGELHSGTYSGFDVEIARYIAAQLGYEGDRRIEWVSVATEDRIPALQGGAVDLVVATFSMTEEREKLVSFAGPYLVTTQEAMIPTRHKDTIHTIEDLRDPRYKVCTSGGSTTEAELGRHQIRVFVVKEVGDCIEGILQGRYDAVSSDETILAGFLSKHPKDFTIVDMPFGTSEQIGVGVPISDPALRDLVAFFLDKSYQQGRKGLSSPWLTAYHQTLGPWLRAPKVQPPPLKVPELVDFDDKAPR
ncbi:transporter substrate-binding domain-containing protein [Micromonospora sp. RTGN7]|uniref:transporter substrate-binding domain-containing protein n=1 Tax=Micromonospora sp. RTGN7 TaxID=3016526 RepID=UPI0029FEFAD5|nr:transporter substrate-binding domain-containing protein [Micromonospora sp. RTGN7]